MDEWVGCRVGIIAYDIGPWENYDALFATISYHLEPNGWGTKYPELMNRCFQGRLSRRHAEKVREDIRAIREELKRFPPSAVIWDYKNPGFRPPKRRCTREHATDLSDYFVSDHGRNVFDGINSALQELIEQGGRHENRV
jgi:hypothetical protein